MMDLYVIHCRNTVENFSLFQFNKFKHKSADVSTQVTEKIVSTFVWMQFFTPWYGTVICMVNSNWLKIKHSKQGSQRTRVY